MQAVKIYTDGACSVNSGDGGWGAILEFENGIVREIFDGMQNTTNNQMELLAPIKALRSLKEKSEVTIFTDSQYAKKGITEWILTWQKNNWKTANKKPVKNKELWQELLSETQKHRVKWEWIKAHNNHSQNEHADTLAKMGVEKIKNMH